MKEMSAEELKIMLSRIAKDQDWLGDVISREIQKHRRLLVTSLGWREFKEDYNHVAEMLNAFHDFLETNFPQKPVGVRVPIIRE